jgi:hypothetical protein
VPSKSPQTITEDPFCFDAAIVGFNGIAILFPPFLALFLQQHLDEALFQGLEKIDVIVSRLPKKVTVDAGICGFLRGLSIHFTLRLPSDGPSRFRPCLRLVLMQTCKGTLAEFTYRGLAP